MRTGDCSTEPISIFFTYKEILSMLLRTELEAEEIRMTSNGVRLRGPGICRQADGTVGDYRREPVFRVPVSGTGEDEARRIGIRVENGLERGKEKGGGCHR